MNLRVEWKTPHNAGHLSKGTIVGYVYDPPNQRALAVVMTETTPRQLIPIPLTLLTIIGATAS